MPYIFTNVEYIYGFCEGSCTAVVEEYRRRFPIRRIPDRRVFYKVFNILRECGRLPSAHVSSERARKQDMEEQENILDMVERSPTASTRRLSARIGVSRTRVWRTLHEDGLYPFHPRPVQNLHPGDSVMRLEFCHWLHINSQLLQLILFTDEATFTRNRINNTRNSHRWSQEIPHGTVETNVQRRFSINVCCGIIDDMLIGPVILDDRMTGQSYLDFLQNELPKQLADVPLATRIAMYFQHDGAPSHYTRHVMQHLNDTFPNRWIGRGSTINWPPRSPDLTPLDFCLWGLMTSEVYRKKVDTRDELLVNILDVIACTKERQDALRRTTRHVFTRAAKCIDVDGGIF